MKSVIIVALGLLVSSCIPTPVTPTPDVSDGNSSNDTALTTTDSAVADIQETRLDSSIPDSILPASDVSVVDSVVASQDSAILDEASSTCAKACNNLIKLGCSEGKDTACVSVCDHISKTNIIKFDAKCLSTAKDTKAVKACGGVACKLVK